ncbi:MAG: hypothetical protein QW703_01650 [Candidatus Aenigmatarchaeota archaeon]
MEFQRRLPAVYRQIDSIRQNDIRVCILGMVVDAKAGRLVLDDGSGKVIVSSEEEINIGSRVRIFGRVIPTDEGVEISAELIQNVEGLDIELWKKAKEMEVRLGV